MFVFSIPVYDLLPWYAGKSSAWAIVQFKATMCTGLSVFFILAGALHSWHEVNAQNPPYNAAEVRRQIFFVKITLIQRP